MSVHTDEQIAALKVRYREVMGLRDDAEIRHVVGPADVYLFPAGGTIWTARSGSSLDYDQSPPPMVVRFDRLPTGELIAAKSRDGRTVCVIVHPARKDPIRLERAAAYHWTMAGDMADPEARPSGSSSMMTTAVAEAAAALGRELGWAIYGWTVDPIERVVVP